MPRLLDLFCGRWGWSKAFAARGWECVGVDLVDPPEIPEGCSFVKMDVTMLCVYAESALAGIREHLSGKEQTRNPAVICSFNPHYFNDVLNPDSEPFDFICASSPCEQFSVHGMKHFHPNPPYPELGIKLFNHTRELCEKSGVPYVMENVRAAQQFVGDAVKHSGPFYLWGNAIPALVPRGILKNISQYVPGGVAGKTRAEITAWRREHDPAWSSSKSEKRKECTAIAATIPDVLANCVASYAERLLEQKVAL